MLEYRDSTDFIAGFLPDMDGVLGEIQRESIKEGYPIISHEAVRLLSVLLSVIRPANVLEIGCAVGFSAGLFAKHLKDGGMVTTIDRYDFMLERARKNFIKMGIEDKVKLIEGDAADILPKLNDSTFDFVFLDAGKAQYLNFMPHCIRVLKKDGVFVADDVLQGGAVALPRLSVPRRQRTTHKRMRGFLDAINFAEGLETCLLPIGDGMAVCVKTSENVVIPVSANE